MFVQEQIGLSDRLFLQVGLRADRNSGFGSEVGTFYLPKFGASYVISEEAFCAGLRSAIPDAAASRRVRNDGPLAVIGRHQDVRNGEVRQRVERRGARRRARRSRQCRSQAGARQGVRGRLRCRVPRRSPRPRAHLLQQAKHRSDCRCADGAVLRFRRQHREHRRSGEFRIGVQRTCDAGDPEQLCVGHSLNGSTLHNEILELGTVGTFINNFRAYTKDARSARTGRIACAAWTSRQAVRPRRTRRSSSAISFRPSGESREHVHRVQERASLHAVRVEARLLRVQRQPGKPRPEPPQHG